MILYLIKGIEMYALLYFIYLVMAFFGWRAWRASARGVLLETRIVLTGPESCGKTELANQLSEQLSVPCVPEIARDYLLKRNTIICQAIYWK